jgi:hypothetical protein
MVWVMYFSNRLKFAEQMTGDKNGNIFTVID